MKAAILFPGQGSQYAGMGKDLFEHYTNTRHIYKQASEQLDWDIQEVCFEDQNDIIHQTYYTQAALFTTNYAIYEAFKEEGLSADAVLGFSLGEYDAIVASGALSFAEGLELVQQRGQYMDACAKRVPGSMAAVIGLGIAEVTQICKEEGKRLATTLEVANDNCPGQIVISGTQEGILGAKEALLKAGAKRVMPLKVSGAFHSPLMKEAALKMEQLVKNTEFHKVQTPIVSNVTARFMEAEEIKRNIPLQIMQGVRYRESILFLIEQGFDTFIEIGPKQTLSRLAQKISSDIVTYPVENVESLKEVVMKVGEGNA